MVTKREVLGLAREDMFYNHRYLPQFREFMLALEIYNFKGALDRMPECCDVPELEDAYKKARLAMEENGLRP